MRSSCFTVPPDIKVKIGHYRATGVGSKVIPRARLIKFQGLDDASQVVAPAGGKPSGSRFLVWPVREALSLLFLTSQYEFSTHRRDSSLGTQRRITIDKNASMVL